MMENREFQYADALHYLIEQLPMYQRIGAAAYRADLGNITELCRLLGNPQDSLRCIHVGGTNGKGSVSHIIASVLQAQGYRVGVFTSPHYRDYRERIKINGTLISEEYVTEFIGSHIEEFKAVNASFFEMSTAMAFAYFKDEAVDYAIIEVGMGGRLDSTNIITPLLSVITNISLDHTQFLGDTLPLIATEKAGIIKAHVPVVIGETQVETMPIFKQKAIAVNANITFADSLVQLESYTPSATGATFIYEDNLYHTDLSGDYQLKNITTALAAIAQLREIGVDILPASIIKGIASVSSSTYFIGRWMVRGTAPMVIFDSAHNEGGINQLVAQISRMSFGHLHFVYGTVGDKDIRPILSLLPQQATYYYCRPDIPRGKDVNDLYAEATALGLQGSPYPSVMEAYRAAMNTANMGDIIMVSGSIFVVAEVVADFYNYK